MKYDSPESSKLLLDYKIYFFFSLKTDFTQFFLKINFLTAQLPFPPGLRRVVFQ
jgi:hypothetical protein